MLRCWKEDPKERPSFIELLAAMNRIAGVKLLFVYASEWHFLFKYMKTIVHKTNHGK